LNLHLIIIISAQVGGVWINLGPLKYHWADAHTYLSEDELSIELSLEDVLSVIQNTGFNMLERTTVQTSFNSNTRSEADISAGFSIT
jgi:carnosine N-methyltransferase